ncbi:MAG: hypothetical protein WCW14_00160 [Candidatus Paceibacterota bacterium]|jgi:hypothetical protein
MSRLQKIGIYQGPYRVELYPGAGTEHVPRVSSTDITDGVVTIGIGTAQIVMGGIQFYACGAPFAWGYSLIKRIRDAQGEILWENDKEKK